MPAISRCRGDVTEHQGEFYRINGAMVRTLPVQHPRPALVSAGASPAGVALAARWVDWLFMPVRHGWRW